MRKQYFTFTTFILLSERLQDLAPPHVIVLNFDATMSVRPPVSAAVPLHTAAKDPPPAAKEVPDIIQDPTSKRRYEKGKFLGKGGFAKCYELKDLATGEMLAGKIVPKSMLTKTHQKEKMSQVSC
jgi:hypothetical protein